MGMYRGHKPFDREQLVFIVEASLCAAFDKVHGALPTGSRVVGGGDLAHWTEHKEELLQFLWGAVHHVGIFVPILWAQTEGERVGDGMGTCDFIGWEELEQMVEDFIVHNTTEGNETTMHPDMRPLAEKIVDSAWDEYLARYFPQGELVEGEQEYTVRYSADFDATVRTKNKPGTDEFWDDVSDIDIPENSQSTYRSDTFEPTVAIDSEGNEHDLQ